MSRIVGLVPAAGAASRFSPDGLDKELLPLLRSQPRPPARVDGGPNRVIDFVLDAMVGADIREIVVVTSPSKVERLGQHVSTRYGRFVDLAFAIVRDSPSMVHSIDASHVWLSGATVALGMADTVLLPSDCFAQLLASHDSSLADLTLGLFPTDSPARFGMVEVDADRRIVSHEDKPASWPGDLMWGMAVWRPAVTELIRSVVAANPASGPELTFGGVIDAALKRALGVRGCEISDGVYYDVGTFESYRQAVIDL